MTSFVGRRRESAEVKRLLGHARLVTLTGPGGVGKTRLADRVMHQVMRAFRDGAVFVGLAELRDGDLLANQVADALGVQDGSGRSASQAVLDYLSERRQLLVLDNCEHLVDASAAFVHTVLAACPDVVVLTTSRQSLGAEGEHVLPVPPLDVSDDAVQLFVDRAATVCLEFEATSDNAADVASICGQLEGLPLAIELAAARMRSLSVRQIAERLSDRLALLTTGLRTAPERHQALRATVDWSYELCSPAERAVWARASVFAGSFDLAAAEHVCAGADVSADEVLDVIDGLLDKSVLGREETGTHVRYRMLETLREYGREQLEDDGELTRVARLHRDWFDRLTAVADDEWASERQLDWIRRLRADHANLRAALSWSLAQPAEAGVALRMASRLDEYWSAVRGFSPEAQMWLDRALAATSPDDSARPEAVVVAALYCVWQAKLDDADARLAVADELAAAQPDDVLLRARIAHVRSLGDLVRGRRSTARMATLAARTFAKHGHVRRELHPLFILGVSAAYGGRLDAGRRALRRMVKLSASCGELCYQGMAHFGIAVIEVDFGDVDAAEAAALKWLRISEQTNARQGKAYGLDCLAWVAARQEDYVRAATLFGAASTIWQAIGASPDVLVPHPHRRHLRSTRAALGRARFEDAFGSGRGMSEAEAVRYALDEDAAEQSAGSGRGPLTPREAEIAALVAQGLTNRDIATQLVIAPRTADTHMQHILTKLDFTNRAQVAAWVASRNGALLS